MISCRQNMRATIVIVLIFQVAALQGDYELLLSPSNHIGDFDCLKVDNRLFCRRSEQLVPSECFGVSWKFATLAENAVTTDQLLEWLAPLYVVERYARVSSRYMNDYFCNCTTKNSFGAHCEYTRPSVNLAELLVQQSAQAVQRVAEKPACFRDDEYFHCNAGALCLEWRQVCDGIMNCEDGVDERNCELLEFNQCTLDEFQCRNGMCVPHAFLFDGTIDCFDASDEQESSLMRDVFAKCAHKSSFECDERLCRKNEFSCGDGSCVPWSTLLHHRQQCENLRDLFVHCETRRISKGIMKTIEDTGCCQVKGGYGGGSESCLKNLRRILSGNNRKQATDYLRENCPDIMQLPPSSSVLSPNLRLLYNLTAILHFYTENGYHMALPDTRPHRYCFHGSAQCHGTRVTLIREHCLDADAFEMLANHTYFPLPFIFCQVAAAQLNSTLTRSELESLPSSSSYRCHYSNELISTRRLNDGYPDCLFGDDELNSLYPPVEPHYRYRCTSPKPWQYVSVQQLGNGIAECMDRSDELSPHIHWPSFQCTFEDDFACWALRSSTGAIDHVRLHFHRFCDTTWDTMDGYDERNCTQWVCPVGFLQCSRTGQCINGSRLCDGEFDCADGEDELNCTTATRIRWPLEDRICDRRQEHFCITPTYLDDPLRHRPCITAIQAGDGHVDCVGGRDERNRHSCSDNHLMLGDRFLCNDGTCVSNKSVCDGIDDCQDRLDELVCPWMSNSNCSTGQFACANSSTKTCLPGGRCGTAATCTDGSHLFWCPAALSARGYRATKTRVTSNYHVFCKSYPTVQVVRLAKIETRAASDSTRWHGYCNRGFYLLEASSGKPVCFCPPSLYGDQCQFSRRRITSSVRIERSTTILLPSAIHILVQLVYNVTSIVDQHTFVDIEHELSPKHNGYLLYPRPKPNGTYSIRYEAFHVTESQIYLLAVWEYHVSPLDFLPSLRIAKILRFLDEEPVPWLCSSDHCQHNGTCYVINNDPEQFVCVCQREWTGRQCEQRRLKETSCSSKAFVRGDSVCVCPEGHLLPHCFVQNTICQRQTRCSSDEMCYAHSSYPDSFSCLCKNKDISKCNSSSPTQAAVIEIDGANSTDILPDLPFIVQLLKMSRGYPRLKQHILLWPTQLPLRQALSTHDFEFPLGKVPDIGLLYTFERTPTVIETHLSMLYVNCSNDMRNLSVHLSDAKRCRQVHGLDAYAQRLHINCGKPETPCFYTDHYVCYCTNSSSYGNRSECIAYHQGSSTSCNYCENRGLCVQGDLKNKNDFACICSACISGDLCQFSTGRFSVSLEMLLEKLRWNKQFVHIIPPALLFLVGLVCNGASFATFAAKKARLTSCGIYLLINSGINQFVLTLLFVRVAYLTLGRQTSIHHATDTFLCKSLPYSMSSLGLLSSWLMTLVSIERVLAVRAPMRYRKLCTPNCALLSTTIIGLCLFSSLFSTHVPRYKIVAHPAGNTWCIMESASPIEQYLSLVHQLLPFLINFVAGMSIILAIRQSKARCHSVSARTSLSQQIRERADLLVGPFMCFVTQLPQFLLLFLNACTYESRAWFLYTALVVYYISFLPQVAVLFSYVLPSPLYKKILMDLLVHNDKEITSTMNR